MFRQAPVDCRDRCEQLVSWDERIALLLERHPKNLSRFHFCWYIRWIDLENHVCSLLFLAQEFECFWFVARSNDAIRDFTGEEPSGRNVYRVAERRPVAKRTQAVSSSGTGIGRGERRKLHILYGIGFSQFLSQWKTDGRACWTDMLEGGCGWQVKLLPQLLHQLPGVEGIEQINIARRAAHARKRELSAPPPDFRGHLVRI